MASIGYGPQNDIVWQCGGSLISENFVLTAAHCLNDGRNVANWVKLGTVIVLDRTRENVNLTHKGQTHPVLERIVHPDYKKPAKYHDIALLRIGPALEADSLSTFNKQIAPACLQLTYSTPKSVFAAGWGRLGPFGDPSPKLLKFSFEIYDASECNKTFELEIRTTKQLQRGIQDSQICAGQIKGGVDTCEGDSGGPLQYKSSCLHTVAGVTSFGKVCGFKNSLGVYTNVVYYLDWIEKHVWKDRELCMVETDVYAECLPISKCTHIHKHIPYGYRPLHCGYNREEPIVCCPSPNALTVVSPRDSDQSSKSRVPGEAAKQACEEYKQELKSSMDYQESLPEERNHYPHLVIVGYGELHQIFWTCAGSLISTNFVLIAARCLRNYNCLSKWVRLGSQIFESDVRHTAEDGAVTGQVHPIMGVAYHPEYDESTGENDLALVLIGDPIEADASSTLSQYIHPACLKVSENVINEAKFVGIKYHPISDDFDEEYEEFHMTYNDTSICGSRSEKLMNEQEDNSICRWESNVGFYFGVKTGQLQSLIDQDSHLYEVIGIKSFKLTEDDSELFTHVVPYLKWIEDIVWL